MELNRDFETIGTNRGQAVIHNLDDRVQSTTRSRRQTDQASGQSAGGVFLGPETKKPSCWLAKGPSMVTMLVEAYFRITIFLVSV